MKHLLLQSLGLFVKAGRPPCLHGSAASSVFFLPPPLDGAGKNDQQVAPRLGLRDGPTVVACFPRRLHRYVQRPLGSKIGSKMVMLALRELKVLVALVGLVGVLVATVVADNNCCCCA